MRSLKNRVLQPNHTTVRDSSASGTRSPSLKEPSSPGRVVLLFAAPALSEEARALAALGYRVEAYDLVGDEAADVDPAEFDYARPRARMQL